MFKKKEIKFWKHQNIDLSGLLYKMETDLPIVKAEEQDSGLDEFVLENA
jgi:glutamate synthase (NADPH/NADH) large chain